MSDAVSTPAVSPDPVSPDRVRPDLLSPGAAPPPPGVGVYAAVVAGPVSLDRVVDRVRHDAVGGIGVFLGLVRDHDHGSQVTALDYEAHPSATDALLRCARDVAARHDVLAIAVEHATGALRVGDAAVAVAAGAAHRAAALAACAELIEAVKREAPVWKRQYLPDGVTEWVGL